MQKKEQEEDFLIAFEHMPDLAELQRSIEYPEMTLWGGIKDKIIVQFIVTHQFELYERYMPFLGPKNFME